MEFGELKEVDLREAWPDEARDFTPWLAQNLARLSQEVGIDLYLEDTEVSVEGFAADILASATDGNSVVIENQFGRTDHDHLGKALTYLSGLDAQIVIWIAEHFHEAHLTAIRWLNESTTEQFSFLGIELKAVRIGESPLVPVFNMVAQPNDWGARIAPIRPNGKLSEIGQFRMDFWNYYVKHYADDGVTVGATSNRWVYVEEADLNISLALVRNKVGLFLTGNRGEDKDEARERIKEYDRKFRSRFPHWPEDEPVYDCAEWGERTNTNNRANWPHLTDWLHKHLEIYTSILTSQV